MDRRRNRNSYQKWKSRRILGIQPKICRERMQNMKERVTALINQIGNCLDSPAYAEKMLTECGKEILQIVGNLEEQIEILKRK